MIRRAFLRILGLIPFVGVLTPAAAGIVKPKRELKEYWCKEKLEDCQNWSTRDNPLWEAFRLQLDGVTGLPCKLYYIEFDQWASEDARVYIRNIEFDGVDITSIPLEVDEEMSQIYQKSFGTRYPRSMPILKNKVPRS